jgi:hypothetical protein
MACDPIWPLFPVKGWSFAQADSFAAPLVLHSIGIIDGVTSKKKNSFLHLATNN